MSGISRVDHLRSWVINSSQSLVNILRINECTFATPAPQRAKILFRAAKMLEERKEDLARLLTMEMGKVLKEARGDVQEAIDITYYAAGEGRRLFGETTPSELPDKFCMTIRRPIGVVGLITPWNFPMAIPAWKIMRTVGSAIVHHPKIRAVSFTGSLETGKWILGEAAKDMKKVSLELGGKNPIIGDVRGISLMIGVELVEKDRSPASARRDVVVKKSFDGGLILLLAGDSVIRFVPPLILKKTEIDRGLEIFENALRSS